MSSEKKTINICYITINMPFIVANNSELKKKIEEFIDKGLENLEHKQYFNLIKQTQRGSPRISLNFQYKGKLDTPITVLNFLNNKELVKHIGYIIEKVLIFDSYLNTLYTNPDLNLLGVSIFKTWNFIHTGGENNTSLFEKVGKDCSDNIPVTESSHQTEDNMLLKKDDHLCIMPFDTFDKYCVLIQNKIIDNPAIIVTAGTGLGKTVRVPIYLLEIFTKPGIFKEFSIRNLTETDKPNWRPSNFDNLTPEYIDENSMILCALPKNVLVKQAGQNKVILNAVRKANLDGAKNNMFEGTKIIGYILKDEPKEKTMGKYLNFITAGLLNTKFKNDPKLENFNNKNISCVIIDEAHERSLDIDILLQNLKKVAELRPNFKIVIMSATIKACLFREYLFGEKMEYGNESNEECDKTNPKTFEIFNEKHVNMYVPIIHVEKQLQNLENYYTAIGLSIPDLIDKTDSVAMPEQRVSCNTSGEIEVSLKYLKKTCINSNLIAGLLTHLITQISIKENIMDGKTSYNESLKYNSIGISIEEFFEQNITEKLLDVNKDIIIFVASRQEAIDLWMILSNYGVFVDYDCFYFESSKVSILRPFATDQKRKYIKATYWCENIIPRKHLPYRWPRDKPAWENYDLPSDQLLNNSDHVKGRPQIIIATNAIESSITFEYCGVVIDIGTELRKGHVSSLNMDTLSLQPIVKSSANQRKGRTGRKAPGICYRLYTENVYNNMLESKKADILSENLDFLFIKLLDNDKNFLNVDFIESPSYIQINTTINRLIKAELIPEDFNIYTIVEDLDSSYKEKIKAFNQLAIESKLKTSKDPIYFNLDLPAIHIWYSTDDQNLKILMAFFIWINNRPKELETKFYWDKPKEDVESVDINIENLPVCSLLALFNNFGSLGAGLKIIYSHKFLDWIKQFKDLQEFKIDNYKDKLTLEKKSFDEMNNILKIFNQTCKFGSIDLYENTKIYFETNIGNTIKADRNISENTDCYFFSNQYFNGEFKIMFLNVDV